MRPLHAVYMGGRPGLTAEEQARIGRFLQLTAINQATGCREWLAAKQQTGYGMFSVLSTGPNRRDDGRPGRSAIPAHRASYYLFVGELNGLQVRHRCHNPGCVEPTHLRLGTAVDNARDKRERRAGINHLDVAYA